MKKLFVFLVFAMMLVAFASCKKDPEPNIRQFRILDEMEQLDLGSTTVTIHGQYDYAGRVDAMGILLSSDASFQQCSEYPLALDGKDYEVTIDGLSPKTRYYYCYSVDYGTSEPYLTDTSYFTTLAETPVVRTLEAVPKDEHSYTVRCELVSAGGNKVNEKGICWNDYGNPCIDDNIAIHADTTVGEYSCVMSQLVAGKRYYVCAYVKADDQLCYGEVVEVELASVELPVVSTIEVAEPTAYTVRVLGNVASSGSAALSERGVCWGTEPELTVAGEHQAASTVEVGDYWMTIEGLTPKTDYYVCAYAVNEYGVSYGCVLSFSTTEAQALGVQVFTLEVYDVQATSAVCAGYVSNDGDTEIVERGICWDLTPGVNISLNVVPSGAGVGDFSATLTGLDKATHIYYRAYAITSESVVYGGVNSFYTLATEPALTTNPPVEVTMNSVVSGGEVLDNGGLPLAACGLCWSTHPAPTVSDDTIRLETAQSFTGMVTGLESETTYYLRAFAANNYGVGYGEEYTFTTLELPPQPGDVPEGALSGSFAVSDTEEVMFSKGNLQYQASTDTWRFAERQYDYVGDANTNASSFYDGWIDLFAWATSNQDHGAVRYHPWEVSNEGREFYAYGDSTYCLEDQTGQADWGYNPISNGGNQSALWRTLTTAELEYVFFGRSTPSGLRYCKAVVAGVNGVVLFPQSWLPEYYPFVHCDEIASFANNVLTASEWSEVEAHGAVFLPAAGLRHPFGVNEINTEGHYWSSTPFWENGGSPRFAGAVGFGDNYGGGGGYGIRCYGYSVRLVCPSRR